ncbi:hypothetical protein A3J19_03540 [Candidatus Daviesbacteria bacterium RIFCSPLOWO2_02_FULL_41_8]|uniref:Uncharacterized protein n=2 Tax=Candidatus Daviesiibacteriota TaxID=1752718 RepID=A0A1F5NH78_9BACT|nr:MAG: hypothetical protein A3D83_04105 [Candidatus Daviesbacteria bacterium RIFCSPHIGHO2_02_FULL_41_10]OGE76975.1 MAG: hypothetical protein A3J19_03540 [Candidatus Daviesbacteria bacterium RIFCSPLOWO2_02_FULL_41_8]
MLAERGGWNHAGQRTFDLIDLPGVAGVEHLVRVTKDLAGEVLKAIRTRLCPQPVLPSTYPEGLQRYAESLTSHGFSPRTLVSQESGTTVSPDGACSLDRDLKVIKVTLNSYHQQFLKDFADKGKELANNAKN